MDDVSPKTQLMMEKGGEMFQIGFVALRWRWGNEEAYVINHFRPNISMMPKLISINLLCFKIVYRTRTRAHYFIFEQ